MFDNQLHLIISQMVPRTCMGVSDSFYLNLNFGTVQKGVISYHNVHLKYTIADYTETETLCLVFELKQTTK